jgi:hypothetical protein
MTQNKVVRKNELFSFCSHLYMGSRSLIFFVNHLLCFLGFTKFEKA